MEPCVFEHRLESLGIIKTIDSVHQSCSLSTDVSLQPSGQGLMPRTALNGAPHSDSEATAWNEYAVRLSQRLAAIRKELQALLTHYDVERAGGKGQSHGIPFTTQSRGQLPTAVFVRHFSSSPPRIIGVTLSRADRRDRGPTSCSR